MKRLLLMLSLTLYVNSAYTQTLADIQKAKLSAKAYLIKSLNNPNSYSSASWGKLSKTYTDFYDSKDRKVIDDSLDYYNNSLGLIKTEMHRIRMGNILKYQDDSTYKSLAILGDQVDSAAISMKIKREVKEKAFKPLFNGYAIDHSFRARNKFNALVLQNWFFVFNKTMKVIAAGDSDESERQRQDLQRRIDELTNKKY